jgi:hypothetical protein
MIWDGSSALQQMKKIVLTLNLFCSWLFSGTLSTDSGSKFLLLPLAVDRDKLSPECLRVPRLRIVSGIGRRTKLRAHNRGHDVEIISLFHFITKQNKKTQRRANLELS